MTTTPTSNILAIDTSTEACSVAVYNNGQVIAESILSPREHTQRILPMVDACLEKAGISLAELDCLAYGRGPGSFTGVRIGIGIAQGLAFGAALPMTGISTLQAMAQQAYREQGAGTVLAAIDARMGEVYWGEYRLENGIMVLQEQEHVLPPEAVIERNAKIDNAVAVGTGWGAYEELAAHFDVASPSVLYPAAEYMLSQASDNYLNKKEIVEAENAEPVYLRDKVTWKKLPSRE